MRRSRCAVGSSSSTLADSPHCLQIVGHSNRKGSAEFKLRLFQQRATMVRQILLQQSPALATRLATAGMGWAQTLVCSGSDDKSDAPDRRLEFRVVDCP